MLRRLVSSNTVEFKKPPAESAPEETKPVEPSGPFVSADQAPTVKPEGENGSDPALASASRPTAHAEVDQSNGETLRS